MPPLGPARDHVAQQNLEMVQLHPVIIIITIIIIIVIIIIIIIIKRDFLKDKTVKTNDKIRRFGVVMTPLSR